MNMDNAAVLVFIACAFVVSVYMGWQIWRDKP